MGVENVGRRRKWKHSEDHEETQFKICTDVAEKHKKLQNRYQFVWGVWKTCPTGFASGWNAYVVCRPEHLMLLWELSFN